MFSASMHGLRPLKNKTGKEVTKAFESILGENRVPQKLQTDKGTEFFNKHFQQLMKKYDIHHFATASDVKASVVERFNRTLRGRMTRFLTAINSKSYYNVLQDLIDGYNASYHKSIKMRPWTFIKKMKKMCLIICTARCVKTHLSLSIKLAIWLGYLKSEMCFLRDTSRITQKSFHYSSMRSPESPVYRLQDYDGDIIEGCFYEKELQKIIVNQDKSLK